MRNESVLTAENYFGAYDVFYGSVNTCGNSLAATTKPVCFTSPWLYWLLSLSSAFKYRLMPSPRLTKYDKMADKIIYPAGNFLCQRPREPGRSPVITGAWYHWTAEISKSWCWIMLRVRRTVSLPRRVESRACMLHVSSSLKLAAKAAVYIRMFQTKVRYKSTVHVQLYKPVNRLQSQCHSEKLCCQSKQTYLLNWVQTGEI